MFIYLQFFAEVRLYFTAGRLNFTAGRLHFTAGRMQKKRPAVKSVLAYPIASFSWIKNKAPYLGIHANNTMVRGLKVKVSACRKYQYRKGTLSHVFALFRTSLHSFSAFGHGHRLWCPDLAPITQL